MPSKMGSIAKGSSSSPQDLKVTVLSSSTLHPSEPREKRTMFLSNIDQLLNFSVDSVHFFPANPDYPMDTVAERVRSAVERVLVPYDFLAGRLSFDQEEGRFVIDCNDAGVGFLVASSELGMAEIGELDYPNPVFRQLVQVEPGGGDQYLLFFQVTTFKCGGVALGISNNHTTFDGISFQIFLKNLAALAAGQPLLIPPCTDRRLLAARSPPRVTFPHPELIPLDSPSPTMLDATADKLEFHLFRLGPTHISALKAKATEGGPPARRVTSFNAVTAHIWRCRALAARPDHDPDRRSTVLYAVDIRPRLRPPLPPAYTGNGVLSAYATLTLRELEEGPLGRVAMAVAEGAVRMDDEYARSVIDWGEEHKGFPCGDVFVSSWWRMGYEEVEFPWGRPAYTCPVVHPQRDIVLLLPSLGGASKGVNALVALPPDHMERYEILFYKFLA